MSVLNRDLRKKILEKGHAAGLAHYSSSLSCVDAVAHIYRTMSESDRFILSKGHAAMAMYTMLEERGFSPKWEMHPEHNPTQGIYATTGSLGHGLPIGSGYAMANKLKGNSGRVYVLLGDGEISEGTNWEALSLANKFGLDLTAVVDYNNHQIGGSVKEVSGLSKIDLVERLRAFGCETLLIDGHDEGSLKRINYIGKGLQAVVLETVPGKGVSFLERTQPHGHDFRKTPDEYKKALEELS